MRVSVLFWAEGILETISLDVTALPEQGDELWWPVKNGPAKLPSPCARVRVLHRRRLCAGAKSEVIVVCQWIGYFAAEAIGYLEQSEDKHALEDS